MPLANGQPRDLFQLAAVTPAELAAIATAAAGSPVTRPVARRVPLAYDWDSPTTAGLWRVDVTSDGEPACALFVKLVRHTRLWPMLNHMPDEASRAEFVSYYPWHYELDIHQAGIESVLPGGMRMPVLRHVTRPDDDHMGLWWEFIRERPGGWDLADYRLAARLLGQLAARRRAGAEVNKTLPAIARTRASALRFYTSRRVISGVLPALRAGEIWRHPVLQAALGQAAEPALPADMLTLGERLPQLLDMLDELPQTYAHGDASPQNLLLPRDEPGTIDYRLGLRHAATGRVRPRPAAGRPGPCPGHRLVAAPSHRRGDLPRLSRRTGQRGLQGRPRARPYRVYRLARSALRCVPSPPSSSAAQNRPMTRWRYSRGESGSAG